MVCTPWEVQVRLHPLVKLRRRVAESLALVDEAIGSMRRLSARLKLVGLEGEGTP